MSVAMRPPCRLFGESCCCSRIVDSGQRQGCGENYSKNSSVDHNIMSTEDRNMSTTNHNMSTEDHNMSAADHNMSTEDCNMSTNDCNMSTAHCQMRGFVKSTAVSESHNTTRVSTSSGHSQNFRFQPGPDRKFTSRAGVSNFRFKPDVYQQSLRTVVYTSVLLVYTTLVSQVYAIKLLPVHWNSTNPMFRLDNTDHVLDVSIGDVIDVVCPQYPRNTPQYMIEQHVLYQVTREEYESCRILHEDNRVTRQVLKCTKPYELQKLTIVFREYTPVPNGLEYVRGQDYYYISTSTGRLRGLYNRAGGHCRHQNMKMVFKVCCGNEVTSNDVTSHVYHPLAARAGAGNSHGLARHQQQQQHQHAIGSYHRGRPAIGQSQQPRQRQAMPHHTHDGVSSNEVVTLTEEEWSAYIPMMDMLQSNRAAAAASGWSHHHWASLTALVLSLLITAAHHYVSY